MREQTQNSVEGERQGAPIRLLRPLQRRGTRSVRRVHRGVYLLPSMFTMANMFCGYACIVYSMRGEFATAAPFIGVAIVLDMLDGRVARMTGTTSAFGVEFDSLADVISFGVAPAIMSFVWGLQPLGRLGWAAGFLFVAAAAVRLARFNIQSGSQDKRYFVGMPSPSAAAVPAATVFAFPEGLHTNLEALPVLAMVIVPSVLMVSTIRFRSFKTLDLQSRRSYPILFLFAVALALLASHTQVVLLVLAYTYLASAFIGMAWSRLRRRSHQDDTKSKTPARSGNDTPAAV
jgi:CDP-diacylglycerol--serine O-phosphatidyltransferase